MVGKPATDRRGLRAFRPQALCFSRCWWHMRVRGSTYTVARGEMPPPPRPPAFPHSSFSHTQLSPKKRCCCNCRIFCLWGGAAGDDCRQSISLSFLSCGFGTPLDPQLSPNMAQYLFTPQVPQPLARSRVPERCAAEITKKEKEMCVPSSKIEEKVL